MNTKFGTAIGKGTSGYDVAKTAAQQAMQKAGVSTADLAVVFSSSNYNYADVLRGINEVTNNAPLIGCSTAGEFIENKVETGSIVCAIISSDNYKFYTGIGSNIRNNLHEAIANASKTFPKSVPGFEHLSAIVLSDGLAGNATDVVDEVSKLLGAEVEFAGGTAGDDLHMKETTMFHNSEIKTDAVVLALIASKSPVSMAVKHGHISLSPVLKITKAEKNIVYEINDQPAFSIWRQYARDDAKKNGIDVDSLGEGSKELANFLTRYEAGILEGVHYAVRWPGLTTTTSGPMTFACTMPVGTRIRVMGSPTDRQVLSAGMVAGEAMMKLGSHKPAGALIFDCCVRGIILGQNFIDAINRMFDKIQVPFAGFETYGEYCKLKSGEISGFHNTTSVVILFPD